MGYVKQRKKGGNFHAYWTGVDGERKRKSTNTQDPVAARQRLREYERDDSVWRPPGFTVARACALAGEVQLDKENTEQWRRRCAKIVTQHLYRLLGKDTDLNAVNIPKLVSDYARQRLKEKGPAGKPISKANIRKELLIVRQGAEQGQIYGEFFGNLRLFVPKHLSKKGPQREVRLTVEQANKLLAVATPHRRPWLVWAIHSGVDIGATHKILKTDVDLTRGRYGVVYIPDSKNEHRPRTIPLTKESRWAIDERMKKPGELLFTPMWDSDKFKVCMRRWCPLADIPERIVWKDLRRTTSSLGAENGVSELILGRFLGWSGSSEMLRKVYMHLDDSVFHELVEKLPALDVPDMCQTPSEPAGELQHNSGSAEIHESDNSLQKTG